MRRFRGFIRSRLVGKVHANAAPMPSGLMRISVGAAAVLGSPWAGAADAGGPFRGDGAPAALLGPEGAAIADAPAIDRGPGSSARPAAGPPATLPECHRDASGRPAPVPSLSSARSSRGRSGAGRTSIVARLRGG